MKSLQTKIFIFFVLLLMVVQAIALWTIVSGYKSQEKQEIDNRLTTAKTIFTTQYSSRKTYLAAFAETAAKDYGLKQVFEDDIRSLLVAMNNHRKRIDADLVMAISADAKVSAQLKLNHLPDGRQKVKQGTERGQNFRFPQWLENQETDYLYFLDDTLYQISLSPINVGTKTIGWLVFGFQIDQKLAQHFSAITQLTTDFVLKNGEQWQYIASSHAKGDLAFSKSIVKGFTPQDYIAIGGLTDENGEKQLGFAMYGLRADLVAVLQQQWWQWIILTMLTMLVSLALAYVIAASITKPIRRLVQQAKKVASGDYNQHVDITDNNELGQLAKEFNVMQAAILSREKDITHRANHDPLTDLPNRNFLKSALTKLSEENSSFTVFHLNMSRLKDVNETLGHEVGDSLIQETAKRLNSIASSHLVSHVGGDEFVILHQQCTEKTIQSTIDEIHLALEENCLYQGVSLPLQVRIGIAHYPEHNNDVNAVLRMADTALHHTQRRTQQVKVYDKSFDVNSVERLNLTNDLKHAISDDQLALYYQPKMNLQTGLITHVEALVRWQHPTLGMVPPDNFIYIAEQTGQINALTRWVFIAALKQYQAWKTLGLAMHLAVNISAENLKEVGFYHFICQALSNHEVPPENITLEITESAVVEDPTSAIALLRRFKEHGMKISIDDYGTGYSSLAQLKQLPVHELKIDKSFVQHLQKDEDDRTIVRSTIELAHNMGLSVVAEGIEDDFALRWLAKHGCELGQGYFINRPRAASDITPWLLEHEAYTFE